jgi:tellurite resistance protein TerC
MKLWFKRYVMGRDDPNPTMVKRVVRVVLGCTLLIIGIALLVLPGPAFIVIPLALAVLAGEFLWAHKLLKAINKHIDYIMKRSRDN